MIAMIASYAKNNFGKLIDMAQKEPILIEKYGRPFVVVMSHEDYESLKEIAKAKTTYKRG